MSGKLSTHILDNYHGRPASNVAIELFYFSEGDWGRIQSVETNADGRTDKPLLQGDELHTGFYRLVFKIGPYFRNSGVELPSPAFLENVAIEVNLLEGENYHVPLLTTPWSYSTYRGS